MIVQNYVIHPQDLHSHHSEDGSWLGTVECHTSNLNSVVTEGTAPICEIMLAFGMIVMLVERSGP